MARYDLDLVRSAAADRWPEIFSALASVAPELLDGQHHGCPKCGGSDRFRAIDTAAGALLCNQCFSTKNGDGFAALQWLLGIDFKESLRLVADYVGISPEKGKKQANPAEHLDFLPWNATTVSLWCQKKQPTNPAAVESIGGRLARYRKQYTVIAFPVWGPSLAAADPVGWILYRADGGELPKFTAKGKPPEWVKVKLTHGSQPGVVGSIDQPVIWKVEGSTDLVALVAAGLPDGQCAFTTANGAQEKPADWIVKAVEGKTVYVVHDADEPGQQGATFVEGRDGTRRPGWCPVLAQSAAEVRNVALPYQVERTHGKDLRDYLVGGGSVGGLLQRAAVAPEVFTAEDAAKVDYVEERPEDPARLARMNLRAYETEHDGRLLYWRDQWLKWKGGRYRRITDSELTRKVVARVEQIFQDDWRERQRTGKDADKPKSSVTTALVRNVVAAMEAMVGIPDSIEQGTWLPDRSRRRYLSLLNQMIDLDALLDGKGVDAVVLPHSPEWFMSTQLGYAFDPEADCPRWLQYLTDCMEGDHERIAILQEWAGYLLTNSNDLQRFLVLEGEGGNGKTVYFAAITAMLGEDNISSVPLAQFGDRFALASTIGKAANIDADVDRIDSVAEGVLKAYSGGDRMTFDRKNREPITAAPTAKLMFSWNTRPRLRDRSQGLWRRLLLVPFNKKPSTKNRNMTDPQWWIDQGEAPGILLWAIAGLHRLQTQGEFTRSHKAEGATEDYRQESNPAAVFLAETLEVADVDSYITSQKIYDAYRWWCDKAGHKQLNRTHFFREFNKFFPDAQRKQSQDEDTKKKHWAYFGLKFS